MKIMENLEFVINNLNNLFQKYTQKYFTKAIMVKIFSLEMDSQILEVSLNMQVQAGNH